MLNDELLTIAEVLRMSGVSRYTLHRDTVSGKIASIKFGKAVRYRKSDAEKYAAEKSVNKKVEVWKQKKFTQQKN